MDNSGDFRAARGTYIILKLFERYNLVIFFNHSRVGRDQWKLLVVLVSAHPLEVFHRNPSIMSNALSVPKRSPCLVSRNVVESGGA